MSMNDDLKRQKDRARARKWLGKEDWHLTHALELVFGVGRDGAVSMNMRGNLARLREIKADRAHFLALGLSGLLVGDGFARPEAPAAGKQGKGKAGERPARCTLTRKGLRVLLDAGHPERAQGTPGEARGARETGEAPPVPATSGADAVLGGCAAPI